MPTLEQTIQEIIANASANLASEIAQAVRQSLAHVILAAGQPVAVPVVRARGRAAAVPADKSPDRRRKATGRRVPIAPSELTTVLDVLQKKPGLTSVQIQKEAGIDAKQAARVLNKLRQTKRVKWQGTRSTATYSVT